MNTLIIYQYVPPSINGYGSHSSVGITTVAYQETNNFIQLPDTIIGVNNVFKSDANTISSGMFNIKYQIFLNDLYYYGALDLLNYAMTKTYLEDISRILTPDVQLRFNKKQHRLYLDIDWASVNENSFIIVDCIRIVDPSDFSAAPTTKLSNLDDINTANGLPNNSVLVYNSSTNQWSPYPYIDGGTY